MTAIFLQEYRENRLIFLTTFDILLVFAAVVELADALDSKSCGSDTVSVRPRPAAPKNDPERVVFWCRASGADNSVRSRARTANQTNKNRADCPFAVRSHRAAGEDTSGTHAILLTSPKGSFLMPYIGIGQLRSTPREDGKPNK